MDMSFWLFITQIQSTAIKTKSLLILNVGPNQRQLQLWVRERQELTAQ